MFWKYQDITKNKNKYGLFFLSSTMSCITYESNKKKKKEKKFEVYITESIKYWIA